MAASRRSSGMDRKSSSARVSKADWLLPHSSDTGHIKTSASLRAIASDGFVLAPVSSELMYPFDTRARSARASIVMPMPVRLAFRLTPKSPGPVFRASLLVFAMR